MWFTGRTVNPDHKVNRRASKAFCRHNPEKPQPCFCYLVFRPAKPSGDRLKRVAPTRLHLDPKGFFESWEGPY